MLTAFTAVIALSWVFPLFVLHKRETEVLVLDEAFLVAMALLLPPFEVIFALGVGMAIGLALRRRGIMKTVFNAGQTMTAAGMALATMYAFSPSMDQISFTLILSVISAAVVFFGVQTLAVSIAISLSEHVGLRDSLARGLRTRLLVWSGNVSIGLIAGIAGHSHPWGLAFAIIPMAVLQIVYNSHIRSQRDRDRMNGLLEAAMRAHVAVGSGDVEGSLTESLAALLVCDDARLDISPPSKGEIGTIIHSGGSHRWLVASAKRGVEPFDDSDRNLLEAVAGIGLVALENASLFESAKEERRKLADVVGSSSDGIFSVDQTGMIMSWNPAMETITGYPATEMIGTRHLGALRPRDPEGRDTLVSGWTSSGDAPTTDIQILASQGETRWLSCTFSRMPDGGYVVVARDVTTQREVEQLKADFLATVSHELRTPLTPIQGFMQTLLRDDVRFSEEDRHKFYTSVLNQTGRLTRLLNDLLDAVRLQSQDTMIAAEPIDWEQVATGVVDVIRQQCPDREIALEIRGHPPVVMADAHRGEQILFNLLNNADKYSKASLPIKVIVAQTTDSVITSVIDSGPGIRTADRERIFERFTRLGSHLTRPQGGLGLGLFISRRLVEAMGGRIWVEPNPEGGSVFSFTLPVSVPLVNTPTLRVVSDATEPRPAKVNEA